MKRPMPQMSTQNMQQNVQPPWDTNTQIEQNRMSPRSYSQGHKGNAIQSQEIMANQKVNIENQANNEQDMEIGYEDKNTSELTFEGLEQKFQGDTMKLIEELTVAEDEENARHKERIIEINTRYQEKVSSLRVQHASQMGEFVRKESEARLHHYQQAATNTQVTEPQRGGGTDPRDYGWASGPEARGPNGPMPDRENPQFRGGKRSQENCEERVPNPHGRVHNNSGARY